MSFTGVHIRSRLDGLTTFPPVRAASHLTKSFTVEKMPACPGNDLNRPDDFLTGAYRERRLTGECVTSGATGMVARVQTDLAALAASIQAGVPLTAPQRSMIDMAL